MTYITAEPLLSLFSIPKLTRTECFPLQIIHTYKLRVNCHRIFTQLKSEVEVDSNSVKV